MIESEATAPSRRSVSSYHDILSLNSDQSVAARQFDEPGFGTLVSQGAVLGMLMCFGLHIDAMLAIPGFYNYLIIAALPNYLGIGLGIGSIVAAVVWACGHLAKRRLGKFARCIVALLTLACLGGGLVGIVGGEGFNSSDLRFAVGFLLANGLAMGLFIGSHVEPWRELVREQAGSGSTTLSALTGIILRLTIVFFLMMSIVSLAAIYGLRHSRQTLAFGVIAVVHFALASALVFARLKFWVLLPLAILVTSPIVPFVTDVLTPNDSLMWYVSVSYLGVWAVFLWTRATDFRGKGRSEEN